MIFILQTTFRYLRCSSLKYHWFQPITTLVDYPYGFIIRYRISIVYTRRIISSIVDISVNYGCSWIIFASISLMLFWLLSKALRTQPYLSATHTACHPHFNLSGRYFHLGSSRWHGTKYIQNQRKWYLACWLWLICHCSVSPRKPLTE